MAIARALAVNNPDILLADEPTGALDSETSIQVMELLKEVAKDRLVVMVTHNPELAQQYATRIVNLKDGVILSDTALASRTPSKLSPPVHKSMGRSSMSPLTSLGLSFNNLLTKRHAPCSQPLPVPSASYRYRPHHLAVGGRQSVYRRHRKVHPVRIPAANFEQRHGPDLLFTSGAPSSSSSTTTEEGMVPVRQLITQMVAGITSNDLKSLKAYLESSDCTIAEDATSIEYSYNVQPQIYRENADGTVRQVNPDLPRLAGHQLHQFLQRHDVLHDEHQRLLPAAGERGAL